MSDTSNAAARTLKLVLEYDGTRFHGWQTQPDRRTVQGEVERAIATITREHVRIFGASRTDGGVHALGQVASLTLESRLACESLKSALNATLEDDVAVLDASEASPGFHARRDARGKHYRYRILARRAPSPLERGRALHVRAPLDVAAMDEAARALAGTHDFGSFESRDAARDPTEPRSRVRTITEARVRRAPEGERAEIVTLDVAGDGFLYNMVRAIAGTLLQVGRGRRDPASIAEVIAARDRAAAGPTAPPHGLYLVRVFYEEAPTIDERKREESLSTNAARAGGDSPSARRANVVASPDT